MSFPFAHCGYPLVGHGQVPLLHLVTRPPSCLHVVRSGRGPALRNRLRMFHDSLLTCGRGAAVTRKFDHIACPLNAIVLLLCVPSLHRHVSPLHELPHCLIGLRSLLSSKPQTLFADSLLHSYGVSLDVESVPLNRKPRPR